MIVRIVGMIWVVCCSISCGDKAESLTVEVPTDNTRFYEVLFNEAMEIDSVLLNGKLAVVCSIDSAIIVFGDILEVYYDYRFSFDQFSDRNIKHYVFKNAIFREWHNNQLILVTLAIRDGNYLSYSGVQIISGYTIVLSRFFPEHIDIELWRKERANSYGNASSLIFCVSTTKKFGIFSHMKWIFTIRSGSLVSVELYNPN